ncbi:MAG TPA: hypothetical protein VGG73_08040 [Vicinamibacterales bacterium]|jgi:hypothetical protein
MRTRNKFVFALVLLWSAALSAQAQRGRGPATPQTAKQQAPIDLTGYWVSVVTEDWRYRMIAAPKGDHPGLPLSAEGNRVANAWDPAKDEAAGEQCKAYGAAGVMRAPGRLHITWESDQSLKVETEAGTQTRLFNFGTTPAASGAATWQGTSVAQWEVAGGGRRGRGAAPQGGSLKVVTTHMRPGYVQKNGVPYGENAVLTEYFSRTTEPNGDSWLILTHIVEDPQYWTQPLVRSTHFRKVPDSVSPSWTPEACSVR